MSTVTLNCRKKPDAVFVIIFREETDKARPLALSDNFTPNSIESIDFREQLSLNSLSSPSPALASPAAKIAQSFQ